jgi:hypothetical protein
VPRIKGEPAAFDSITSQDFSSAPGGVIHWRAVAIRTTDATLEDAHRRRRHLAARSTRRHSGRGQAHRALAGRFCHGGALSSAPDLVARVFEGPHDRFRLSHCKERVQATSAALSLAPREQWRLPFGSQLARRLSPWTSPFPAAAPRPDHRRRQQGAAISTTRRRGADQAQASRRAIRPSFASSATRESPSDAAAP